MQNTENYKLIGVINSYNTCPDFVRPVFKKDEKYYIMKGNLGQIDTFIEIKNEIYHRITRFEELIVSTNINLKLLYQVGDMSVICFRLDKDNYFISDIDNFVPFIKKYQTDDEILKEEIDNFLYGVKQKNKTKKKIFHIKNPSLHS